jgi:hypothetical protein
MHTANHYRDRAILLSQVAQECPQFKEQAEFLASEWLLIAALRVGLETGKVLGSDCD